TSFENASVPIIANVDALPHQHADQWADLLEAQLTAQVRWRQTIERMVADGISLFVELGPGTVLTGVAKRQAPDGRAVSVSTPDGLDAVVEAASTVDAVEMRAAPSMTHHTAPTTEQPPMRSTADHHEGEHLFAAERLVVSPA